MRQFPQCFGTDAASCQLLNRPDTLKMASNGRAEISALKMASNGGAEMSVSYASRRPLRNSPVENNIISVDTGRESPINSLGRICV